ncbi:GNAT family N-acetyltransferase [Agathobacter sp.]
MGKDGGHIAYAVRPDMRNNGLATQMLQLGLKLAKNFGYTYNRIKSNRKIRIKFWIDIFLYYR